MNNWRLEFDMYNGGGTTANLADGNIPFFYKDESVYADGVPYRGGGMGFIATGGAAINGYGVEFDGFYNSEYSDPDAHHIAIIEDHVDNHLASIYDERVDDEAWHSVVIDYANGEVIVVMDGTTAISHTIAGPDTSDTGIGFSAATGGRVNNHILDNVILRKYSEPEPTTSVGTEEHQSVNIESSSLGKIKAEFK